MSLVPQNRSVHGRLTEYTVAIVAVLLAFGARLSLDSTLENRLPFQFFYLSTLIAAWYGGIGPGLMSLLLGFLLGDWFFFVPRHALGLSEVADVTPLAAYL